jgi:hypothetical protein
MSDIRAIDAITNIWAKEARLDGQTVSSTISRLTSVKARYVVPPSPTRRRGRVCLGRPRRTDRLSGTDEPSSSMTIVARSEAASDPGRRILHAEDLPSLVQTSFGPPNYSKLEFCRIGLFQWVSVLKLQKKFVSDLFHFAPRRAERAITPASIRPEITRGAAARRPRSKEIFGAWSADARPASPLSPTRRTTSRTPSIPWPASDRSLRPGR